MGWGGECVTHRQIFSDPYLFGTPEWQSFIPGERKSRPGPFFFFPLNSFSGTPFFLSFFLSLSVSNSPSFSLSSCDKHQGDVTSVFGCDGRTTKRLWKSIKGGKKRATRVCSAGKCQTWIGSREGPLVSVRCRQSGKTFIA